MPDDSPAADQYSPEYDADSESYRVECDDLDELSTAVVFAVASVADLDVTDLPPLNDVVDPDGLDRIFTPKADGEKRDGGFLSFVLADHRVEIHGDGEILVTPPE